MKDLKFTPGPWQWHAEDYSHATLHGKDYIEDVVMTSQPCESCCEFAKEKGEEWKWGRCTTPNEANAQLIAKAPEMYEALKQAKEALDDDFAILNEMKRLISLHHDRYSIQQIERVNAAFTKSWVTLDIINKLIPWYTR